MRPSRLGPLVLLLVLGACDRTGDVEVLPLALGGAASGDGSLHVTFLDVGQGESTLIRSPTGRTVLIGAGPVAARPSLATEIKTRAHGRIDLYLSLGGDEDGVELLQPSLTFVRELVGTRRRLSGVQAASLPQTSRGLDIGGATLRFLGEGSPWGVRIEHGEVSLAILRTPTDDELAAVGNLASAVTLLRAPGSAAEGSTPESLVRSLKPRAVVVSVGAGNLLEAPAPQTLRLLSNAGAQVFRTDLDGTLELVSDGRRLTVTPARPVAGDPTPLPVTFP